MQNSMADLQIRLVRELLVMPQDHLDNPNDVVSWEEVKARLDAKYRK